MAPMTSGLERYQEAGHLHFVTFSCYHRHAYLNTVLSRELFEASLERTQRQYEFQVVGYVVMPEHVHLLLSEPRIEVLGVALQSLKINMGRQTQPHPFWQSRYYDFNVFRRPKLAEKLNYIHWNPVKRGLVTNPEDWRWSSCYYYKTGEPGLVTIEPDW
jgi:putative transposase